MSCHYFPQRVTALEKGKSVFADVENRNNLEWPEAQKEEQKKKNPRDNNERIVDLNKLG